MDFPNAVRKSLRTGGAVPCNLPYTGIQLLQLIQHHHIDAYGLFRQMHLLTNPGGTDTLITYVRGNFNASFFSWSVTPQRYLERLVAHANRNVKFKLRAMNVKQSTAMKAGFNASISLDGDLAKAGFKATSDNNWSLSFGNGRITKKSVGLLDLHKFLEEYSIPWCDGMDYFKGVVTAIYSVTGGLTYTGDFESVTTGAANLRPTNVPARINAGWRCRVTETRQVQLSEIDPHDWIIAIEFIKLESDVTEGGTGNPSRTIRIKPRRKYLNPDRHW